MQARTGLAARGGEADRRLTRSTMFFLLVSARGPDTNASHRSCCSPGSSASEGGQGDEAPVSPAASHPPLPPALTLQELPQLLSVGPLLRVLHQGIGHSRQVAHVASPRAPHRPEERAELQLEAGVPPGQAKGWGNSLCAVVLLPGCQDALH